LGIFLAIASTFQDCGFTAALIQRKNCTHEDYCTAFYFNLVISLAMYLTLYLGAPWIADFYKISDLTMITRVVALSLVIQSLCAVHQTKLTIDLRFGIQSIVSIVSLLVTSAFGISLAYMGYGAWALVWQSVFGSLFNMMAFWWVSHWRPSLIFSKESFKRLFGFGSKLLCSGLINTIYGNLYTLVIGRKFSAADIGYFNRALGFADLPTNTLGGIVLKVNYPILAKLQDDNARLLSVYGRLVRSTMFLLIPVLFGMAVVAEPMVKVLIGEKWLPCVPFIQVLCLGVMWNPLTHINLNLLYVKNRTDLVLKLELIKKPIAFLILIAMIPFGIFWMCVGRAAYDFIAFCFNCYYTKKLLDYGFVKQMCDILPAVVNSLCMMGLSYMVMTMVDTALLKLIIGISAGVVSYLIGAVLVHEESLFYIAGLIRRRRRLASEV